MKVEFTITKNCVFTLSLVANFILVLLFCCNMHNIDILRKRNVAQKNELNVRQGKINNLCEKFDCNEDGLQMKNIVDYSYTAYKLN